MRTHLVACLANAAAAWLLFAGCCTADTVNSGGGGGSDAGTSPSGDPEDAAIDAFCDAVLPPFCEALYACCTDMRRRSAELRAGATPEECVQNWKSSWCLHDGTERSLKASLKAGTIILNQTKVDECVAQLKAMATGGVTCVVPPAFYFFSTCFGAFQGQIEPGQACEFEREEYSFMPCKGGRCDNGICVPFLKTGDACPFALELLNTNLTTAEYCNYPEGEWCQLTDNPSTGTCGPVLKVGSICASDSYYNPYACMSHHCGDENTCEPPRQLYEGCRPF
jgi:hypothetical protein